ncbi:UNVERIFIED_CONTAM: hypothetical protein K2H54_038864 [Gekko kuhli]
MQMNWLVFREKPQYPPSRAQASIRTAESEENAYLRSIRRLFCNVNFVLLVASYGQGALAHPHNGLLPHRGDRHGAVPQRQEGGPGSLVPPGEPCTAPAATCPARDEVGEIGCKCGLGQEQLSSCLNTGCFYALSTLLNRMVMEHYPGQDLNAGRIGLTLVVAGMVGALISGIWLDRTKTYNSTVTGNERCVKRVNLSLTSPSDQGPEEL